MRVDNSNNAQIHLRKDGSCDVIASRDALAVPGKSACAAKLFITLLSSDCPPIFRDKDRQYACGGTKGFPENSELASPLLNGRKRMSP